MKRSRRSGVGRIKLVYKISIILKIATATKLFTRYGTFFKAGLRIRTFLVGSGKFSPDPDPIGIYFGYVKVFKQGKNILNIELLHIFRSIFPVFQIKIFIIQISEEI